MAELFADLPEALENTLEIAKRCNIELTLGKNFLPDFPIPPGMTHRRVLVAEAKAGLEVRLAELYPDPEERLQRRPEYDERLVFECNTIIQMGFPGYFLIVADFINWAKNNGVPVGPGRGSGAGSLVAYSLRITDIDPLAYALLFERFLNPERVSMPDFDVDFCQDNRWRSSNTSASATVRGGIQIATFGTMSSKAVIRDVGRVLRPALFDVRPHFQADSGRPEQAGVAGRGAGTGAAAQGANGRRATAKPSANCSTWPAASRI
jgi:DNA polymerase-3 subunit alpha